MLYSVLWRGLTIRSRICYNQGIYDKICIKNIQTSKAQKRLTQLEVAEKAGIHPNTYAKIEEGLQKPSFATIKKNLQGFRPQRRRYPCLINFFIWSHNSVEKLLLITSQLSLCENILRLPSHKI